MKKELQDKLISKYACLFDPKKKIYTSDNPFEIVNELTKQKEIVLPIQFGFECEDGWYVILDELMDSIKSHISSYNNTQQHEPKNKFIGIIIKNLKFKCKYKSVFYKLFDYIYEKLPKGQPPMFFRIDQIKEKYGTLRFYYTGGDDIIFGMVYLAENLTYSTCETCGSTKNVGQTSGWVYTICKKCLAKHERAKQLEWKQNKK